MTSDKERLTLTNCAEKVASVSDIYAQRFQVTRNDDWYLLKIQEEVGELASAWLKLSARARVKDEAQSELEKNLADEVADVLAHTLLFAHAQGIDVQKALEEKWFKYL